MTKKFLTQAFSKDFIKPLEEHDKKNLFIVKEPRVKNFIQTIEKENLAARSRLLKVPLIDVNDQDIQSTEPKFIPEQFYEEVKHLQKAFKSLN